VVLANKELFIERQGNFGNVLTGDSASAARYIECRVDPIAREILWRSELTQYTDSYDGRNREPVVFPAKIALPLILGAEGIAVGMSTRVLPHNFAEVVHAQIAALRGETVELYPDFIHGGIMDVSEYNQGQGRVLVRARLDTSDEKRIVIREVPFGTTTESLINSIDTAARRGKIKIAQINDYTGEEVEIEIRLPRGVYTQDVVDGLFAFTDCEQSISVNLLLIADEKPRLFTVPEVVSYHAQRLVQLLEQELIHEREQLLDRLHMRTLERIFIEERIYQRIEEERTSEGVSTAVRAGFVPFRQQLIREITDEDIERLLKIPIRRISLYDIERNRQEVEQIRQRLQEIEAHLADLVTYAVSFLEGVLEKHGESHPRRTEITGFNRVDIRDAAVRDRSLHYDSTSGYLGYTVTSGTEMAVVSIYDRVLVIDSSGRWRVLTAPEKQYIGPGAYHVGLAAKEILAELVFTLVYRSAGGDTYIKRFTIEQFILEKEYELLPDGAKPLMLTTRQEGVIRLKYRKKPRIQKLEEDFSIAEYLVKGYRAMGVRLSSKQVSSLKLLTLRALGK
jgi:topoisomerase-4 subunit A